MSESKEHRVRQNLRLTFIAAFYRWLAEEPPMWRVFAWRRWKRQRPEPTWTEAEK